MGDNVQEKIRTYAAWTVVIAGALVGVVFFLRYLAAVFVPFALGWGIALAVRHPAARTATKLGLAEGVWRLIYAILATALLGLLIYFGLRGGAGELSEVLSRWESGEGVPLGALSELFSRFPFLSRLFPNATDTLSHIGDSLLTSLPGVISRLATAIPSVVLTVLVTLVAAIYFCLDLDRIHAAILSRTSTGMRQKLHDAKENAFRAAWTVLRSSLLLMLVSLVLMLIGFPLVGVPSPILLSLLLALFDLLPAVGAGTVLFPWGILLLLLGNTGRGIGILSIAVVNELVRHMLEPHLIGARYGMHPLLTLLSMYAGARLCGVAGMFLAPMGMLLVYGMLFPDAAQRTGKPQTESGTPDKNKNPPA